MFKAAAHRIEPKPRLARRDPRPRFLNLAQIRYPVGAIASIGHRISGLLLACALPFVVLLFERSLGSETAFASLMGGLRSPAGRIVLVILAWAAAQHLLAGIRHLLSDIGVGSSLGAARKSAFAVLIAALAVAVIAAVLA